jgi:alpha-tubulin suppressor-like RCC1 family protein
LIYRKDGSIGLGNNNNQFTPAIITSFTSVTSISAGTFHSMFVDSGKVYVFGSNSNKQLGKNGGDSNSPIEVSGTPTGVKQVAAGQSHSLYLKIDGTVFGFGQVRLFILNRKGFQCKMWRICN